MQVWQDEIQSNSIRSSDPATQTQDERNNNSCSIFFPLVLTNVPCCSLQNLIPLDHHFLTTCSTAAPTNAKLPFPLHPSPNTSSTHSKQPIRVPKTLLPIKLTIPLALPLALPANHLRGTISSAIARPTKPSGQVKLTIFSLSQLQYSRPSSDLVHLVPMRRV